MRFSKRVVIMVALESIFLCSCSRVERGELIPTSEVSRTIDLPLIGSATNVYLALLATEWVILDAFWPLKLTKTSRGANFEP